MMRRLAWIVLLLAAVSPAAPAPVELRCPQIPLTLLQAEKVDLAFTLSNRGAAAVGRSPDFFLSYHLYDERGKLISFDNRRFPLPVTVAAGERRRFTIPFFLEAAPGRYRLEFDLVKEGQFWGRQKQWASCWLSVTLNALPSADFAARCLPTSYRSGEAALDREQHLLRMILKNGEIRRNGALFGFSAGSDYPQIWIRDTATFLPYARYFYPLPDLRRMVQRFLERQERDGGIVDWLSLDGRSDKNTVETDQESSLVLAACTVLQDDPAWWNAAAAGAAVSVRLDRALEWVWRNKRDPGSGLILSGFTADWGDVERSYPDQRAVKWSDRSRAVVGVYTQAKFIQAALALAEAAQARREEPLARKWRTRAAEVRRAARLRLYRADKGYFLVHRTTGGDAFLALEQEILAVGGNAEAALAGMFEPGETARLLRVLQEKRAALKLRSVSFTLLPPYPAGFFPHPLLREPWSYQNGGEWDWIGGRMVRALFRAGFRAEARRFLDEIVAKHQRSNNVFEWEGRDGRGRGAHFYVGAAGVIGQCILEELFGLQPAADGFTLESEHLPPRMQVTTAGVLFSLEPSALNVQRLQGKTIALRRGGKTMLTVRRPGVHRRQ